MTTTTTVGSYKNHPTISVWDADKMGEDDYPILSLGVKKAQAVLAHIKDLEAFVKANTKEVTRIPVVPLKKGQTWTPKPEMAVANTLSPEQQAVVDAILTKLAATPAKKEFF